MKKILLVFIIVFVVGCKDLGDEPFNKDNLIFTVTVGDKDCVPVELAVYEDKTYELFNAYQACPSGVLCNDMLVYTRSIKGVYDYDVMSILDDESMIVDGVHPMDQLPKYDIYMSDKYVKMGYGYNYSVSNGKENESLQKFLDDIGVNLGLCADADY